MAERMPDFTSPDFTSPDPTLPLASHPPPSSPTSLFLPQPYPDLFDAHHHPSNSSPSHTHAPPSSPNFSLLPPPSSLTPSTLLVWAADYAFRRGLAGWHSPTISDAATDSFPFLLPSGALPSPDAEPRLQKRTTLHTALAVHVAEADLQDARDAFLERDEGAREMLNSELDRELANEGMDRGQELDPVEDWVGKVVLLDGMRADKRNGRGNGRRGGQREVEGKCQHDLALKTKGGVEGKDVKVLVLKEAEGNPQGAEWGRTELAPARWMPVRPNPIAWKDLRDMLKRAARRIDGVESGEGEWIYRFADKKGRPTGNSGETEVVCRGQSDYWKLVNRVKKEEPGSVLWYQESTKQLQRRQIEEDMKPEVDEDELVEVLLRDGVSESFAWKDLDAYADNFSKKVEKGELVFEKGQWNVPEWVKEAERVKAKESRMRKKQAQREMTPVLPLRRSRRTTTTPVRYSP